MNILDENDYEVKPFTFSREIMSFYGKKTASQTNDSIKISALSDSGKINLKYEDILKKILYKIHFFEKPDIIPYPFEYPAEDIINENQSSGIENLKNKNKSNPIAKNTEKSKTIKKKKKKNISKNESEFTKISKNESDIAKVSNKSSTGKNSEKNSGKNSGKNSAKQLMIKNNKLDSPYYPRRNSNKSSSKSRKNTPLSTSSKNTIILDSERSRISCKESDQSKMRKISSHSADKTPLQQRYDFDDSGIDCETCIRLHKHPWAKSQV